MNAEWRESRIEELLRKPYAGSKAFRINHPTAEYVSNCHGTTCYVFGLHDAGENASSHPGIVNGSEMQRRIDERFIPLERYQPHSIIAFYLIGDETELIHTAIVLKEGKSAFHQTGTGGWFEKKKLEDLLRSRRSCEGQTIEVKSYQLKNHS